jgi:hypothetical protein
MQSAERKSIKMVNGQFLAVPDEINVGGLSTRFAPTPTVRKRHKVTP